MSVGQYVCTVCTEDPDMCKCVDCAGSDAIGRQAANQKSPLLSRCKVKTIQGEGGTFNNGRGEKHTSGQVSDNTSRGRGSQVTKPT